MMTRREAYLGVLKYRFGEAIIELHLDRRAAWAHARYWAATYTFGLPAAILLTTFVDL